MLFAAALLSLRPAVAATVTWDTSTTAGFQSGSGNWSDLFWTTNGTTLLPWVSGDVAVFSGGASAVNDTINLSSAQTVAGLTFGSGNTSGNWTITGSDINLATTTDFTANAGSTAAIGNIIRGAFGLNKSGVGVLRLSGNNTYAGITTLAGGVLEVASLANNGTASSLGVGTGDSGANMVGILFRGGTLRFAGSTAQTTDRGIRFGLAGGTIDASGTTPEATVVFSRVSHHWWENDGTRTITLTGSNTGANTIIAGLSEAPIPSSTVTNLVKQGAGTWVLAGSGNYKGTTEIKEGLLVVAASGALGVSQVTISGGKLNLGNFDLTNTITLSSGILAGSQLNGDRLVLRSGEVIGNIVSGSLAKSGTGAVILRGNNTYAGGTTVSAGTLIAGSNSALGSGAVTVSGGTLDLGTSALSNTITLSSGTLAGSQLNGDKLVLQGGEVTGVIVSGALSKTGNGTVTLSGANTYAGGTTVSAGTLVVNNANALGSGAVTLSGGSLDVKGQTVAKDITLTSNSGIAGTNGTISGVISGAGLLIKSGAGTVTLSGANTYAGGTTVSAGTLVVNNANALGAGAVTLSGGSLDVKGQTMANNITLTADSGVAGTNGTISGVISGSGLLTKSGTGTLTLSGNNTFEGGALVNAGTLVVNGEVLGNMVVSAAAKVAGSGIVHDVTVVAGGSIKAGGLATVGTLRADTLGLQGGSKIELNVTNAALGAGNGFDRLLVSGMFDLSAAALTSKCQLILAGLPVVFDPTLAYSFDFLKYGSLNLGGNNSISDLFTIDVNGLKDQLGGALDASKFRLVDDAANQRILLNYGTVDVSPIPEPSTYGLSLGCLGLAIAAVRRRRRRRKAQD